MKINVRLNQEEQKSRQSEVWNILASTLPPAPKKTLIRMAIAGALFAVSIVIFVVIAVNNLETNMIVFAVIVLIVGVVMLSGGLYDVLAKSRKRKKLLSQSDAAIDAMFAELSAATDAEYEFGGGSVTAVYSDENGAAVKTFTVKQTECAVTAVGDKLCVDFSDTDAFCFTAEETGQEKLFELKKLLLTKHEVYRDVERDERGKYYIAGSDE